MSDWVRVEVDYMRPGMVGTFTASVPVPADPDALLLRLRLLVGGSLLLAVPISLSDPDEDE